jgi:hypothetical protein
MRICLCLLALAMTCLGADVHPATVTLNGKLIITETGASLETADHKEVALDGDSQTQKLLHDARLNGFNVEAKGHYTAAGRFLIDPIHTRALLVRKDGALKLITYWCDVCSIRSFTPGPCVCCQKETTLDLRDPNEIQ